mgnify:FL=1
MVKRYLDEINLKKTEGHRTCYVNNPRYNLLKIHNNVVRIDFTHLYNLVLIQMYDEGLIPDEKVSIESIKHLLSIKEDVEESDMYNWRYAFNTIWSKLFQRNRNDANMVCDYMHHFYQELLHKNNNEIIYIDTDCIILNELSQDVKNLIDELGLPYKTVDLDYFYLIAKKRYAYTDENHNIKIKGLPKKELNRFEKLESMMRTHIREDKLVSIGL